MRETKISKNKKIKQRRFKTNINLFKKQNFQKMDKIDKQKQDKILNRFIKIIKIDKPLKIESQKIGQEFK